MNTIIFYTIWLICSLIMVTIIYLLHTERENKDIMIQKIMVILNKLIILESQKKEKKGKIYQDFEKIINDYIINSAKEDKKDKKTGKKKVIDY